MTTKAQDFEFHEGENVVLEISVVDGDGAAKDLTSATIQWRMVEGMDADGPNVLQKTTSDDVSITNAVGGIFQVALDDSDTAGLAVRDHLHQAVVTFSNGDVAVVTQGKATVLGQIVAAA